MDESYKVLTQKMLAIFIKKEIDQTFHKYFTFVFIDRSNGFNEKNNLIRSYKWSGFGSQFYQNSELTAMTFG